MQLPSIKITFQSKAVAAIERGKVGIVALILKDASVSELKEYKLQGVNDIPDDLSSINQEYLEHAFMGTPRQVKAVVIPDTADDYSEAQSYLETIKWNIGAVPGISDTDTSNMSTWVKGVRDNKDKRVMMVLPDQEADHEAVINLVVEDGSGNPGDVTVEGDNYSASDYTARIAGLIAGLPLTVAPTFQVLNEVDDVPHLTVSEANTKIDNGKFILYHDGEKVKVGRGITSLTSTTEEKSADWKKIKLVRILDLVYRDIKGTIEDTYIGKYQNSYEDKLLLISAINAYFEILEQGRLLDPGKNRCQINIDAQKTYLEFIGYDTEDMSEQEIKEANTRDKVFLKSTVRPLDAIEDVELIISH